MAERRRRQDWARPPGPPPAPRMEHPGTEHNVPPYTSLQANRPEHRGAAQGGERAFAPRQPADQTPPTAALESKIPIRARGSPTEEEATAAPAANEFHGQRPRREKNPNGRETRRDSG